MRDMATVRDHLAEAVRTGNPRELREAVSDWLSGLSTNEELASKIDAETADSLRAEKIKNSTETGDIAPAMAENEEPSPSGGAG